MLSLSRSRRPSISESDAKEIERAIEDVERNFPLEIRVVVANTPGAYPIGSLRFFVVLFFLIEALAYTFWVPLPMWTFHIPVFALCFFSAVALSKLPFSHWLVYRKERAAALFARATQYFLESDLSQTKGRNAVLLYFSPTEKHFHIFPDKEMVKMWPNDEWRVYADELAHILHEDHSKDALKRAILALVQKIKARASQTLPPLSQEARLNELSNAVVFVN